MTVLYSDTMNKLRNTVPQDEPDVGQVHGRLRRFNSIITLASQATTDTIEIAKLPKGARFAYGVLTTDTSLGTATVAIGIGGSTAKYKAAGTLTATDTPTLFGKAAVVGEKLTAEEILFITIGTAALPASGRLVADIFYTVD